MKRQFSTPDSLAEGRPLLTLAVSPTRRKQLGQCFTGLQTGHLLAALAVHRGQRRMIDPMAGHGDLIESVAVRAARLHLNPDVLMGVEIEPEAARLGEWRVGQCSKEFGFRRGRFIHGDAFATTTWKDTRRFDLVITNPPYVRYQTHSKGGTEGDTKLLNAGATRDALERIVVKLAPPEEHAIWQRLIHSYSGLADLSIPSWLLCGLLAAPAGVLALVVPQTWLNRDYARIVRYFFLRFFQPLAIVQECGQRWFRDALVPVSLVVGRRLSSEQVIAPLQDRTCRFGDTPFAEISPAAASVRSHVGNAFRGDDPEAEFADWLGRGTGSRPGVQLKYVSWESQRNEVLAVSCGTEWLRQLEGDASTVIATASSTPALPFTIASHLPAELLRNTRPLSSVPIRVGQGLRTGCNAFFYMDIVAETKNENSVAVLTSKLFGKRRIRVPVSALKPVLRRQAELSTIQISADTLRGRLLDLREFVLPEDAPRDGHVRQNPWRVMPEVLAEYIRLAARTHLVRGERQTLIPYLSAVKPNGLGPGETCSVPNASRMWYMVPNFSPRHLPSLCVPRIIHHKPYAILNADVPVLIDANFSTLWCEDNEWDAKDVFAILNSTWGELCMESLGATLGGGALKLEAIHLRKLPIPDLSGSQKESLRHIVSDAIDSGCLVNGFRSHRAQIDRIVVSALAQHKVSVSEAKAYIETLEAIIRSLRAKRRRSHSSVILDE